MTSKAKKSAGLLAYRRSRELLEVFIAHMGGPFWEHKDDGAWSIPKGEFDDEEPLTAAIREFIEETSLQPSGSYEELKPVKQPSGKTVYAYAFEWDCDPTLVKSMSFSMEWPKGSGVLQEFPEIDRAGWFPVAQARKKLLKGQVAFLDQLEDRLHIPRTSEKPQVLPVQSRRQLGGEGQLSLL